MSTNLLIGLPTLFSGSTVAGTATFSDEHPVSNVVDGSRQQLGRLDESDTACGITFDTGAAASRLIEFLFVARANIAKAMGSKRLLLTGATSGNICGTEDGFQSIDLYGRNSEDALFTTELANSTDGTLPSTATNQSYQVDVAGSGTCPDKRYACSVIMAGSWFDFGRDVRYEDRQFTEVWNPGNRSSYTKFTFTWRGLTKAVKDAAIAQIVSDYEKGLILYTRTEHSILLGRRVVHAFVQGYDVQYKAENSFDLTISFAEQV